MTTALALSVTADVAALRRNVAALVQPEPHNVARFRRTMANRAFFNVSFRRIGGLRFLKVGRLTVSFSVSRQFTPL